MTTNYLKIKTIQLSIGLILICPFFANAGDLTQGVHYYHGNGLGAPVAEQVSKYVHKGDGNLSFFTQRRLDAICELSDTLSGEIVIDIDELKANYELVDMNPKYPEPGMDTINFLTQLGLKRCQKFLINGKFYHYNETGQLVLYSSDINMPLNGFKGDIIVMDQQGNIFIHPKIGGLIHHSSFFSQKPLAFAAMIKIKDGEIVNQDYTKDELTNVVIFPRRDGTICPYGLMYYSGHYDCSENEKRRALENFLNELHRIHIKIEDSSDTDDESNYSELSLQDDEGVLTLYFKKQPGILFGEGADKAALMFENFKYNCLIYLDRDPDSCPCNNKVFIEDGDSARNKINTRGKYDYIEYASWKRSHDELKKAVEQAEQDENSKISYFSNSITFATRIMESAGLKNAELSYWKAAPDNLKSLVEDKIIQPEPDDIP